MIEKFSKQHFSYSGKAVGFRSDEIILPNKNKAYREYLTHPGAVAVIPFIDSPHKNSLLNCRVALVEQFRYPVRLITQELPAGKMDGKESASKCLARELKEETGYTALRFGRMISYWPTPAFSNEVIHIYWADGLKKGKNNPDEDEFLRVKTMTFGEMLKKVQTGKIRDSKTVIGVLYAFTLFQKN